MNSTATNNLIAGKTQGGGVQTKIVYSKAAAVNN
jgi:hypothetical protein